MGLLILKTVVFKMHSYLETNREYETRLRKLQELEQFKESILAEKKTDANITAIDKHLEELENAVTVMDVKYPENVTIGNFAHFLVVPSVVYDIAFPRTPR